MNGMNETKILKDQQNHFIGRLKDGLENLYSYDKQGKFGEIKTISGKDLRDIRQYCWDMVDKFRKAAPQEVFKNNVKGKLGEKIVEKCLGDLVSRVRYDIIPESGDGKVDLTVNSYHTIGIQVKTRYGKADEVKWLIDSEEIEKNKAIVCVLLHKEDCELENFDEFKHEYKPIIAGFLPTDSIHTMVNKNEIEKEMSNGKSLVKLTINNLLYGMGLESYIKTLINDPEIDIKIGNSCMEEKNYKGAVENYTKAINKAIDIEPVPNCHADAYEGRGIG
ncbi:MAG: hypothetical protein KME25_33775 [Symplocastrum torsivum CPER-KK1]|jgi:tetratricopeptide (TPR) repeat protein|uniref:Uncharacterized protein n=1 Tax=Symplocastrum torsivum CPER-KK1 TaxID=450513 RepID=A0A951PUB9_9CYAN|nr:hypothetical protein [Symplocastrum torsivum CPER-KK1]